jgi:hypothetical protein
MENNIKDKFNSLDEETKKYFKYFIGEYTPKIGDKEPPKGEKNPRHINTKLTQVDNVLHIKGFPHPKYKLVFQDLRGNVQKWVKGDWYRPKKVSDKFSKNLNQVGLKWCSGCKVLKKLEDFPTSPKRVDGLDSTCKDCKYKRTMEFQKTDKYKKHKQEYYQKNKAKIDKRNLKWQTKNKSKSKIYRGRWKENNPEKMKLAWKKSKEKFLETPAGILHNKCSNNIYHLIKKMGGKKGGAKTFDILGCSVEDFKLIFFKNKPKNQNYRDYASQKDLDHIIPIALFSEIQKRSLMREKELTRLICALWHYSNLQALDWEENQYVKRDYVDGVRPANMEDVALTKLAWSLIKKTEPLRDTDKFQAIKKPTLKG